MTTENTYKYELKIQGLTEQVNNLNNIIMDLRVDLTLAEQKNNHLKLQLAEKDNVREEAKEESANTEK